MSRRWKQFSLRALLLLVAVCAALAGLWTAYLEPYRREQRALAPLQGKQFTFKTEAQGPAWLMRLARGKYSQRVVWVDVGSDVSDDDIARLRAFRRLRTAMISNGPRMTDEGLAHLVSLPDLESLSLGKTQVSREGLTQLQAAQSLRKLWIQSDRLDNDGLIPIGTLRELRELGLQANVTDDGMRHLATLTKLKTLRCLPLDRDALRMRSLLSTPSQFVLVDSPLLDACEFLAGEHNISIRFEHDVIEAAGIDLRALKVTESAPLARFQDGLASLLRSHGLGFRAEAAELIVTTTEAVEHDRPGISALRRALPCLSEVDVWW